MWGSGSQSPFGPGSQSPGGFHGFSQEFGFSQSQTQAFEPSQSTYGLSQASQLSQVAVPECTECHSTEMSTTDDGDMVGFSPLEREDAFSLLLMYTSPVGHSA